MEHIKESTYRLSSGREIYVNEGIIGIDTLAETIYHGYDGYIDRREWDYDKDGETHQLTEEERIEVAEYTIELWKKYIEKIKLTK